MKMRKLIALLSACSIILSTAACSKKTENSEKEGSEKNVSQSNIVTTEKDSQNKKDTSSSDEESTTLSEADKKIAACKQLYKDHLKNVLKSEGEDRIWFELIYLDSDSLPELVYMHPGGLSYQCTLMCVKNNKVVDLGKFGYYGSFKYVEKGGMIFEEFEHTGESCTTVSAFSDGKVEQLWKGERKKGEWSDSEDKYIFEEFYSDGKLVTENEFIKNYDHFRPENLIQIGSADDTHLTLLNEKNIENF